ncbi:MAG: hypothetical protein ACLQVD_01835 [Capsulimonadaceae bacterium]
MDFYNLDLWSDDEAPVGLDDPRIMSDFARSLAAPPAEDPADDVDYSTLVITLKQHRRTLTRVIPFHPYIASARYGDGFEKALGELSAFQAGHVRRLAAECSTHVREIDLDVPQSSGRKLISAPEVEKMLGYLKDVGPDDFDYANHHSWVLIRIVRDDKRVYKFMMVSSDSSAAWLRDVGRNVESQEW